MDHPITSLVSSIVLGSLLATGSALLLIQRGPTKRLRQLALTVGLISLAQTADLLYSISTAPPQLTQSTGMQKLLVTALSLMAIYILGNEIRDRNSTDRQLRLLEHAVPLPQKSGSGFRFLRALGLRVSEETDKAWRPPFTRGSMVRVASGESELEGMLGEVLDCRREPTGRTTMVAIRVGRSREESAQGATEIGTCSTISMPKPSSATILRG